MRRLIKLLPALGLAACSGLAQAVSDAPLQALNAYIEHAGNCSDQVVEWNRRYNPKTRAGEPPRLLLPRSRQPGVGACGGAFFRPLLIELQKVWEIRLRARYPKPSSKPKAQLIDLFFAALDAGPGAKTWSATRGRHRRRPPLRSGAFAAIFQLQLFGQRVRCLD